MSSPLSDARFADHGSINLRKSNDHAGVDSSCTETKIIILAPSISNEVNRIVQELSGDGGQILSGYRDEKVEILDKADLIRLYASSGKVFASTEKGEYLMCLQLCELEKRLSASTFIRVSSSEILSLKKVRNFDPSFIGTLWIKLTNGITALVSRRSVTKLKKF